MDKQEGEAQWLLKVAVQGQDYYGPFIDSYIYFPASSTYDVHDWKCVI
jgi:hypothetical protein